MILWNQLVDAWRQERRKALLGRPQCGALKLWFGGVSRAGVLLNSIVDRFVRCMHGCQTPEKALIEISAAASTGAASTNDANTRSIPSPFPSSLGLSSFPHPLASNSSLHTFVWSWSISSRVDGPLSAAKAFFA